MNLSFDVSFEPLWFATDITWGHSLGSKILKLLTLLLDLFMLFTTKESKLAERRERERVCVRESVCRIGRRQPHLPPREGLSPQRW